MACGWTPGFIQFFSISSVFSSFCLAHRQREMGRGSCTKFWIIAAATIKTTMEQCNVLARVTVDLINLIDVDVPPHNKQIKKCTRDSEWYTRHHRDDAIRLMMLNGRINNHDDNNFRIKWQIFLGLLHKLLRILPYPAAHSSHYFTTVHYYFGISVDFVTVRESVMYQPNMLLVEYYSQP